MKTTTPGLEWIRRANARRIGKIEFREVTMEIGAGLGGRRLRLRTLRECTGDVARTVFCVMDPWSFRNVNYVATEHKGRLEPFQIQLFLPYVFGTIRDLEPERRREALLGSGFAYDDLRTWLYEEGHRYDEVALREDSSVQVRGLSTERSHLVRHGRAPFDVNIDVESGFVHGIDYWSPDAANVVREYRADEVTTVDDILIPGRMTMLDRTRNHVTTIRLERAWYDRPIDSQVFETSFRKRSTEYLLTL